MVRWSSPAVKRFTLVAIFAASAATLALASILHVRPGDVAVVSWRGGGTPDLRPPGVSFHVPFFQRVTVYPAGVVEVKATLKAASREGSSIDLPYTVRARPDPQTLLALHRDGGAGGAVAALQSLVEGQLTKAAASSGTYDLASGTASNAIAGFVRHALEDRLGPRLEITLEVPVASPELRASFALQAIYGRRVETGARIVLVGIDGGDWDVIDPLIAAGRLPNLARLKKEGAWARMRSNTPMLSPLLWTSVATGKAPDRHGINDFLVTDPRTGRKVPINSTFRRTKAIWNILTEAGLPSDTIAWWATWPAERVQGHLVSDRVAYSTFDLRAPKQKEGAVFPPDYASTVDELRVPDNAVTFEDITRFLHITPDEFRRARAAAARTDEPAERDESINVMVRVLAATQTYRRIALDLLERGAKEGTPARFFAVYFEGVDEVNHRFAHCAPPRDPLCSDDDYRRFKDAVTGFYVYQDAILGEILRRAPGATVIVMSDHGFASGADRPRDVKPFISGRPGLWHDLFGIFIMQGPLVRRGEVPPVSLYDIAPTVLHILGLPVPEDMPGEVLQRALAADFVAAHPIVHVPSYEGLEGARSPVETASAATGDAGPGTMDEATEREMIAQLKDLGYVGGQEGVQDTVSPSAGSPLATPDGATTAGASGSRGAGAGPVRGASGAGGVPTILYHMNLGAVYVAKRQFDQAEAEFQTAMRIDPKSTQALSGMALLEEARGNLDKALEYLQSIVRQESGNDHAAVTKIAELFIRLGRSADGLAYAQGLEAGHRGGDQREVGLRVALGMLYIASGRARDAEAALLRALAIDPASVQAMQELFALYDGQGRSAELRTRLETALARNPRSAMHHNWLGLVLRRQGDLRGAEKELERTLEIAPDLVGAMANLGSLYLQEGRHDDAVKVLRGALEKDPRNLESRTNLIVALGLKHDVEGARGLVKEAEGMSLRAPLFYNGLAYALYVNGRNEEALETLRESLQLDPRQREARRLQAEIEQGRPTDSLPYR
ncbi:MAG: hypothetical protein DMF51_05630 [Acidobacteria bacterium]|nr:MAG: hypothetical protein DMF51_05630 [Acidobacteriota bacterium]